MQDTTQISLQIMIQVVLVTVVSATSTTAKLSLTQENISPLVQQIVPHFLMDQVKPTNSDLYFEQEELDQIM
jgi:hypothetical protein